MNIFTKPKGKQFFNNQGKIFRSWTERDTNIKRHTEKKGNIIYGARSIQAQIGNLNARPTKDFDIYSKQPKQDARQLAKKMNYNTNQYYIKPAQYKDTVKIMSVGKDNIPKTKDDYGIVDFTKRPKNLFVTKKNGIYYSTLLESWGDKQRSLRDPQYKFRHQKDLDDKKRIERHWKMKSDKFMRNFL